MKDSGKRQKFASGMQRDVTEGKTDYTLVLDGPMFKRWAEHLTKGAKKYSPRNWMKASGEAEMERFRQSAFRHFIAWMDGERDEDHAAAAMFNINGYEYVRENLVKEIVDEHAGHLLLNVWEPTCPKCFAPRPTYPQSAVDEHIQAYLETYS